MWLVLFISCADSGVSLRRYIVFGISYFLGFLFVWVLVNVLFWSKVFKCIPLLELVLLAVPFIVLSLILGEGVGSSIGHNM